MVKFQNGFSKKSDVPWGSNCLRLRQFWFFSMIFKGRSMGCEKVQSQIFGWDTLTTTHIRQKIYELRKIQMNNICNSLKLRALTVLNINYMIEFILKYITPFRRRFENYTIQCMTRIYFFIFSLPV